VAQTTLPPRFTVVCPCRFATASPVHHDRLLQAETNLGVAVELFELAVTWSELDYSQERVIPPAEWLDFVGQHPWQDAELVLRLFGVAVDVALRKQSPVSYG
jgi:hypothetical protein